LGVPQGSVLGPLLFILYINDIKSAIGDADINLFADDTLISVSAKTAIEAHTKMNDLLNRVSRWLKLNRLKLNTAKTKFMVVTYKKNIDYGALKLKIDDTEIERVGEIKYLGVVIDDKLKFNMNVDYIIKKVAKKINLITRISSRLTAASKITLYKSLISPHFDYCSSVLFLASDEQLNELQKLQNRMMRIILKCRRDTAIKLMLSTLCWLSVKQRVYFNTLVLIHKMKIGVLPKYLSDALITVRDTHTRVTRQAANFALPKYTKRVAQNSLYYKGVKIYNSMMANTNGQQTNAEFRRKCSDFVKNKYS
jgi:Reverse transcriptase (RNA-dependent DNA polymerase)